MVTLALAPVAAPPRRGRHALVPRLPPSPFGRLEAWCGRKDPPSGHPGRWAGREPACRPRPSGNCSLLTPSGTTPPGPTPRSAAPWTGLRAFLPSASAGDGTFPGGILTAGNEKILRCSVASRSRLPVTLLPIHVLPPLIRSNSFAELRPARARLRRFPSPASRVGPRHLAAPLELPRKLNPPRTRDPASPGASGPQVNSARPYIKISRIVLKDRACCRTIQDKNP